jgi:hypothetical protein
MTPELPRYFAFISYAQADKDAAAWLHRNLERYRIPNRLIGRSTAVSNAPAALNRFPGRHRGRPQAGLDAAIIASTAVGEGGGMVTPPSI